MTKEDKEVFENNDICRFREKEIIDSKVRDHCHLRGKNRGPAHSKSNNNIKQSQSSFISGTLHNFSIYDFHLFFKTLVDKKKDQVEFEVFPKTNEEYNSIRYGYVKFVDSCRCLSSS